MPDCKLVVAGKDVLPLQAADVVAYEQFKLVKNVGIDQGTRKIRFSPIDLFKPPVDSSFLVKVRRLLRDCAAKKYPDGTIKNESTQIVIARAAPGRGISYRWRVNGQCDIAAVSSTETAGVGVCTDGACRLRRSRLKRGHGCEKRRWAERSSKEHDQKEVTETIRRGAR
jgi:hypothetical protein